MYSANIARHRAALQKRKRRNAQSDRHALRHGLGTLLRRLHRRGQPPPVQGVATLKVTFYVLLFGLSLFLVRLRFGADVTLPPRWYLWGNLIALALFPTAISFLCTTVAIQHIGATPTAILGALEPVTAVVFGITLFGERLTPRSGCGMLLIIVAVSLIVAGNSLASYLVRLRKLFPRLPLRRK